MQAGKSHFPKPSSYSASALAEGIHPFLLGNAHAKLVGGIPALSGMGIQSESPVEGSTDPPNQTSGEDQVVLGFSPVLVDCVLELSIEHEAKDSEGEASAKV